MKKIERKEEQELLNAELRLAIQKLEEIVKAEMPKSWRKEQTKKGIKRKG